MFSLTSTCAYFFGDLFTFYHGFLTIFHQHFGEDVWNFSNHRAIQLMVSLGWFGAFLGSDIRMSPPCHKPWLNEIKKLGFCIGGEERA